MPTPVAMSTSEAEYLAACSAAMATAHIRMLLYDMTYLGTKQWRDKKPRGIRKRIKDYRIQGLQLVIP